jgi:DNA-binding transcriptional ArsR family regulator
MEKRMNQEERLARLFKILSVGTRVRILNLIKERALCVNALSQALKITPAAVSQHLRVLRDAGLVTAEKRGYFVHYKANAARMNEMNRAASQLLEIKKGRKEQDFVYILDD